MAKRKTLEERLASYREEAENNKKQLNENELMPAENSAIAPEEGCPEADDHSSKKCCDTPSDSMCCSDIKRENDKNRERLLCVSSLILQGIYNNSGRPRVRQGVNKDTWVYLTGEDMAKAMSQRADIAIQQAKILLEKL